MSKERGTASERLKTWAEANPEKAKEFQKIRSKRWREKHPDRVKRINAEQHKKHRKKILARKKNQYRQDPEKARERSLKWQKNNPEKVRAKRIRDSWGMSLQEYDALIDQAGTTCPICKKSFGENPPCLDHDHSTGKIRGIICRVCNSGIGFFHENINVLLNAVEYLRKGDNEHGRNLVEVGL
jgi:hypothetical protein